MLLNLLVPHETCCELSYHLTALPTLKVLNAPYQTHLSGLTPGWCNWMTTSTCVFVWSSPYSFRLDNFSVSSVPLVALTTFWFMGEKKPPNTQVQRNSWFTGSEFNALVQQSSCLNWACGLRKGIDVIIPVMSSSSEKLWKFSPIAWIITVVVVWTFY